MATSNNTDVLEAQKLVQLAAAQRKNTDVRRATFCIIMSGKDYINALEKLLRLYMSGKQRHLHAYKAQMVRELEEQQGHPCISQQLAMIDDDAVIHVMGRDSHGRLCYMGNHMTPSTYYRPHHPGTGSSQTTPTATTSTTSTSVLT